MNVFQTIDSNGYWNVYVFDLEAILIFSKNSIEFRIPSSYLKNAKGFLIDGSANINSLKSGISKLKNHKNNI